MRWVSPSAGFGPDNPSANEHVAAQTAVIEMLYQRWSLPGGCVSYISHRMAGGGYVTTYKPALVLGDTRGLAGTVEDTPILHCLGIVTLKPAVHISRRPGSLDLDTACKILMKKHHWSTLISIKHTIHTSLCPSYPL